MAGSGVERRGRQQFPIVIINVFFLRMLLLKFHCYAHSISICIVQFWIGLGYIYRLYFYFKLCFSASPNHWTTLQCLLFSYLAWCRFLVFLRCFYILLMGYAIALLRLLHLCRLLGGAFYVPWVGSFSSFTRSFFFFLIYWVQWCVLFCCQIFVVPSLWINFAWFHVVPLPFKILYFSYFSWINVCNLHVDW